MSFIRKHYVVQRRKMRTESFMSNANGSEFSLDWTSATFVQIKLVQFHLDRPKKYLKPKPRLEQKRRKNSPKAIPTPKKTASNLHRQAVALILIFFFCYLDEIEYQTIWRMCVFVHCSQLSVELYENAGMFLSPFLSFEFRANLFFYLWLPHSGSPTSQNSILHQHAFIRSKQKLCKKHRSIALQLKHTFPTLELHFGMVSIHFSFFFLFFLLIFSPLRTVQCTVYTLKSYPIEPHHHR